MSSNSELGSFSETSSSDNERNILRKRCGVYWQPHSVLWRWTSGCIQQQQLRPSRHRPMPTVMQVRYESPSKSMACTVPVPSNDPLSEKAIYCISWSALQGFPPLRKTISPHVKNYDNFSPVFEIAADMSLALFSTMNKWQHVLFLKPELSRLLPVSKMFL